MKKKSIILLIVGVLFVIASFSYYLFYKYTGFMIPCLFHELTGYYCPGCGITRCIFSLIQLDFIDAIHNNLMVFILIPLFLIYYIYRMVIYIKKIKRNKKIEMIYLIIIFIMVIIFGIIRNVDGFDYLVPLIKNI